jgi:diacylglycerol kinase
MSLENSPKGMVQACLEIQQLRLEFLPKFGDIIYLSTGLKNQILSFHGVILFKKIIVNYWQTLGIFATEFLNSAINNTIRLFQKSHFRN